jgi:ankyrin repeat protein
VQIETQPAEAAPQRWVRPFSTAPGVWKQQLATRYLTLAGRGDLAALEQVLAEHPEYLSKRGPHNRTLLWEAARRGRFETVRWLAERGADLQATGCYNGESYVQITPYCVALYYRRPEIAIYLRSRGTREDIFRAAFLGDGRAVAGELEAHPELIDGEDPHDPIYFVPLLAFPLANMQLGGGQEAVLAMLLERGAVVAPYGAQLLHLAARAGRVDLIERLAAHGADLRAVDGGILGVPSTAVVRYLLEHGVSANQPGRNRLPALAYVARGDKGEHPEKLQALLDYGADVGARGPDGRTALHYAAAAGFVRVIALLLQHGADPSAADGNGETPLSLARAAGKTAALELLRTAAQA